MKICIIHSDKISVPAHYIDEPKHVIKKINY